MEVRDVKMLGRFAEDVGNMGQRLKEMLVAFVSGQHLRLGASSRVFTLHALTLGKIANHSLREYRLCRQSLITQVGHSAKIRNPKIARHLRQSDEVLKSRRRFFCSNAISSVAVASAQSASPTQSDVALQLRQIVAAIMVEAEIKLQLSAAPSLCLDHEAVVYSLALQRMPFTPPYSALPQQDLYLPTLGARQHRREGGLAHLRNSGALERERSSRSGGGRTVLVRCVRRKPACRDLHTLGEHVNLQTAARSHLPGD
jgi:hypothetical protein